jgi:hypothetical protein
MIEYVTTNIRLPRELHRELKRRALDEDKSMSQVIRESVAQYLVTTTMDAEVESNQKMLEVWQNDSVWSIGTDTVIADVTDGSVNHDDYLYGPLSDSARAELGDE